MRLADELWMYLRAACPGVFIQSIEDELCISELNYLCKRENLVLAVYDVDNAFTGSVLLTGDGGKIPASNYFTARRKYWLDMQSGPTAALRDCSNLFPELLKEMDNWPEDIRIPPESRPRAMVILLRNYAKKDLLINSTLRTQIMQNLAIESKTLGFRIVIQSPQYELPPELERYFRLIEHKLPGRQEIQKLAQEIDIPGIELDLREEAWQPVLDAAVGLTSYEAADAFAMSINRHRDDSSQAILDPDFIWDQKATALKKQGLLEILEQPITFETLGGVDHLRDNCLTLLNYRDDDPEMKPKGILLSGVPGTGKSAFAAALGHATGRKVLLMDMGKMRSKWTGESEGNIRAALQSVDAMQPCILLLDEVEKALSGTASSGETDGGLTNRVLATMLTWLNNHLSDVFVICTSNAPWTLPPEFSRAERFDDMYFFDTPDDESRDQIWRIYTKRFLSSLSSPDIQFLVEKSEGWTGAEIKSCCKRARRGSKRPADYMIQVPIVSKKDPDSIERMRNWARGVCLRTDKPELYGRDGSLAKTTTTRKINLKDLGRDKRKLI